MWIKGGVRGGGSTALWDLVQVRFEDVAFSAAAGGALAQTLSLELATALNLRLERVQVRGFPGLAVGSKRRGVQGEAGPEA